MRHNRVMSRSLLISFIIHGAIILILGSFIAYNQSPPIKEWISNVFVKVQKSEEPKKRQDNIKPVIKPTLPTEQPITIKNTEFTPRVTTSVIMESPVRFDAGATLTFDNAPSAKTAGVAVAPNVYESKIDQRFITYANIPASTSPEGIASSGSGVGIFGSGGITSAPIIAKGTARSQIRVAQSSSKPPSLPMIKEMKDKALADTGLAKVAQSVYLGNAKVAPLPKGEPGAHIVGRGKDIEGVLRFVRIQHDLSDWWTDPSSLNALVDWFNTHTNIKADLNVEGGSVRLTDPKLMKSPIAFFSGHDPGSTYVKSLEIQTPPAKRELTDEEREGLRKYLIEKGGFLFFDDSGFLQMLSAVMVSELRHILPESPIEKIPNNHELYNCYYNMGGPPTGYDIYRWWGTHVPQLNNYLEGITIGDHLGVLVSKKDYLCAMETVSLPSKVNHYSPAAYRFCINVVVYALIHGDITDNSHYIRESNITDVVPIDKPISIKPLE